MFQPSVLQPTPEPSFVKQLHAIDPDLRVVWGMERYLLNRWVIERRIPDERHYKMYRSVIEGRAPRFIEQPIYDDTQPELNDEGEEVGSKIIGYRKYDLAPEWEWVTFVQEPDESYRPLDSRTLMALRRSYAWERNHPLSRARFEAQQEREAREAAAKKKRAQAGFDAFMDHRRDIFDLPFSGQPSQVLEGTSL